MSKDELWWCRTRQAGIFQESTKCSCCRRFISEDRLKEVVELLKKIEKSTSIVSARDFANHSIRLIQSNVDIDGCLEIMEDLTGGDRFDCYLGPERRRKKRNTEGGKENE